LFLCFVVVVVVVVVVCCGNPPQLATVLWRLLWRIAVPDSKTATTTHKKLRWSVRRRPIDRYELLYLLPYDKYDTEKEKSCK